MLFVNIITLHLLERLSHGPMFPPPPRNSDYQNVSFNFDFSPIHSVITTFADNIGTTYLTNYAGAPNDGSF